MRTFRRSIVLVSLLFVIGASGADEPRKILVLDDCDPNDPAWTPTGGCSLATGEVTFTEFFAQRGMVSFGHPAWRNQPSYLKITGEKHIDVINAGGRLHTFTQVAAFGGGVVPPLNHPAQPFAAAECETPAFAESELAPGAQMRIEGLAPGTHRFQCCIHPWMRAEVRVSEK